MGRKTLEDMLNEEINRLRLHLKKSLEDNKLLEVEIESLKLDKVNLENEIENLTDKNSMIIQENGQLSRELLGPRKH